MKNLAHARVALVHDWLTGMRGGEKCLEYLCKDFPTARLYTLIHDRGSLSPAIEGMDIRTSWLQRIPTIVQNYRYALPAMPFAARWPVAPCDLLMSFSHAVAKAARAPKGVPHVCYCFTPMRYAWHMRQSYFGGRVAGVKAKLVEQLMSWLRHWDRANSEHVTHFIAISETIRHRIAESYGRDSVVIYPPVDTDFYTPDPSIKREDYYLVLSAFAPYKRVDLAIDACNRLRQKLVVIGSGQDAARLKAMAGSTVSFLGWQPNDVLRDHLRRCKALIFPGEEDFGIVPVEANACGTPVIAYGKGGATETITPLAQANPTGAWFDKQDVDCMTMALEQFDSARPGLSPSDARNKSLQFRSEVYHTQIRTFLTEVLNGRPRL